MSISMVSALSGYGKLDELNTEGQSAAMMASDKFSSLFNKAEKSVEGYAFKTVDAQSVVEALSQAELALQTAVTVRDRVVGAYQELLRMPL